MKCLDCGTEMEHGSVEGIGQGGGHWYEFTSDEKKKKTGIKGFFTKKTISVASSVLDSPCLALSALQKNFNVDECQRTMIHCVSAPKGPS